MMLRSTALAALAVTAATVANAQTPNITSSTVYPPTGYGYINYTTVTGYFLQDDPSTNASTFNYTASNFGLINRTYPATAGCQSDLTQWQAFARQVDALNAAAPLNTVYKVLFLGRHGEGYHNAAESFYGTPAWNCYWAELNGNATANWADADLTPNGIAQAQIANNFWRQEIQNQHIPYPQSYYTSPLTRCLRTANITFSGLPLPQYYPFIPTVKELFREGISIHTCDRRSNRTYIHNRFPTYNIEPGFTEYDELWNGVTAESNAAQVMRSQIALDQVFATDDHTWISVTSHSGEIGAILQAVGHRSFSLSTGAVIPVLVKAVFMPNGSRIADVPFTTSTHCGSPPVTSISGVDQGCVCTGGVNVTTPLVNVTTASLTSASTSMTSTTSPKITSSVASATSYPTGYGWPESWPGSWPGHW